MGKYGGNDLLWGGLAIGSIYAIYKLVQPISKTMALEGEALGNVASSVGSGVSNVSDSATGAVTSLIDDVSAIGQTGLGNANTFLGSILGSINKIAGAGEDIISAATSKLSNGVSSYLGGVSEVLNPSVVVSGLFWVTHLKADKCLFA
jgi:phage-related protein